LHRNLKQFWLGARLYTSLKTKTDVCLSSRLSTDSRSDRPSILALFRRQPKSLKTVRIMKKWADLSLPLNWYLMWLDQAGDGKVDNWDCLSLYHFDYVCNSFRYFLRYFKENIKLILWWFHLNFFLLSHPVLWFYQMLISFSSIFRNLRFYEILIVEFQNNLFNFEWNGR